MGAAMAGLRPVAEIMFADFYATCWDQVVNEIAKVRYMTGGQVSVPLVLRGANGSGGLGFGSQHGQSVENWAMCVPGLKIAAPAGPAEAFGLLAAAIRDDDPVLVFEHKALYGRKEEVGDGEQVIPLGRARAVRAGAGRHPGRAVHHGRHLPGRRRRTGRRGRRGRGHRPAHAGAAGRRGRARLGGAAPGGWWWWRRTRASSGWGASVAAIAAQEAFGALAAPVTRVSGGNVPLPVAASLEAEVDVSVPRVIAAARGVLGTSRPLGASQSSAMSERRSAVQR